MSVPGRPAVCRQHVPVSVPGRVCCQHGGGAGRVPRARQPAHLGQVDAVGVAPPAAAQALPEALATDAVDDEVDGRVEHLEHVARLADDEAGAAARLLAVLQHDLDEACRRVAGDEDDDDDDHHQRDVVLGAGARVKSLPASAQGAVGDDEAGAEPEQEEERQREAEHVVEHVKVPRRVEPIGAQGRPHERVADDGRVGAGHDGEARLEEPWRVVDDREDGDGGDGATHDRRPVPGNGAVRVADGQVAAERHQHRHPDGARLADEQQRVGVEARVHPVHVAVVAQARVPEGVRQREVDEPDAEEEVVGDGERA